MTADYPNANARLASVARSWADGEVTHEAWRKCRNGVIRDILRDKRDCPVSGAAGQGAVTRPAMPASADRNPTAPTLPVGAPVVPADSSSTEVEAARDEVLLLALVLAIALVAAILWFYLF